MKSILLKTPGQFEYCDVDFNSQLLDNEVLIKIHKVGICGTDIHAYKGDQPFFNYPRRLGHELGAEVIAIGNSPRNINLKIGDKVSVEPYLTCGHCQACQKGKTNCCESLQCLGVHTDGGMCDFIKMPSEKLHKSDLLSYEQLALVETLGIGCHAVNRAEISQDDIVLVIGAGPIGLSVLQFASFSGAKIVLMDTNQNRIDFANTLFEIDHNILVVNSLDETILRNTLSGMLPSIVFDATGNAKSMANAFQHVAFGGKLIYVGLVQGEISFSDPHFHRREITLLASRNSVAADFKTIILAMETGKIDTNSWITHKADFKEMLAVFDHWLKPETNVIKAMVGF